MPGIMLRECPFSPFSESDAHVPRAGFELMPAR